jgi:hypothetical protein
MPNETDVNDDSEQPLSEVLRVTHLFVILIEDVLAGVWMDAGDGLKKRTTRLRIRLESILKGAIDDAPGDVLPLSVEQRGTGTFRVLDDYGVWSKADLSAGRRLVAFCRGTSKSLVALLQPPQCEQLATETALPDVRASLDLEARGLTPPRMLVEAVPLIERHQDVFARYLWSRVRHAVLVNGTLFELLCQVVERPATSKDARETLVSAVYEDLSLMAAPPPEQMALWARAMLVLLTVPEAEAMHANLAQVYLPNLLGLRRGVIVVTAREVLARTREEVLAALQAHPALDPENELRRWLEVAR